MPLRASGGHSCQNVPRRGPPSYYILGRRDPRVGGYGRTDLRRSVRYVPPLFYVQQKGGFLHIPVIRLAAGSFGRCAMPLYRGTIKKTLIASGESWVNVYTLSCSDVVNAESAINVIAELEKAVTYDIVHFDTYNVINKADKADRRAGGVGGAGALHHDTVGNLLPLFCTYRLTFTDHVKKPEMKYLRRPGFSDQLTAGGSWATAFLDEVVTLYALPLLDMPEFVGPSGERPTSVFIEPAVQNRQLGWHRRTRPGFKRGWVPA
jgi:hypothetical protein